jgi:hypothetical protein
MGSPSHPNDREKGDKPNKDLLAEMAAYESRPKRELIRMKGQKMERRKDLNERDGNIIRLDEERKVLFE